MIYDKITKIVLVNMSFLQILPFLLNRFEKLLRGEKNKFPKYHLHALSNL